MENEELFRAGIDIGSTTAKVVVINGAGETVFSAYRRHNTEILASLQAMLREVRVALGEIHLHLLITGSAGLGLSEKFNLPFIQEVIASTEAVRRLYPQVKTLFDIGGEDAKLIFFDEEGQPDIRMNGACAGGTGAFIDQMATLLNVMVEEMNALAEGQAEIYPIASRCGVFAKTDVQNLLSRDARREDIAASIFNAVVLQTLATLARGQNILPLVLFAGGPLTFLPALRDSFVRALKLAPGDWLEIEHGELLPARGAALAASGRQPARSLSQVIDHMDRPPAGWGGEGRLKPLFLDGEFQHWEMGRRQYRVGRVDAREMEGGTCFLGIDSGSTTTKLVLIDDRGRIFFDFYCPNNGNALRAVQDGLEAIRQLFAGMSSPPRIARSAVTGYGEDLIRAALGCDDGIVETIAHFRAARAFDPQVSFILDIGGQDMKAIFVKEGYIQRIEINEACSSGCGTFIETFARSLGRSAGEFASEACGSSAPCDLGTRCTVFMNSRVKQALREGAEVGDISAGLAYSVIKNALHKVLKVTDTSILGEHIVAQGGAFRSPAIHKALEQVLERRVVSPDKSELMGALGAALQARDAYLHTQEGAGLRFSLDELACISQYKKQSLRCRGCENRCAITKLTFPSKVEENERDTAGRQLPGRRNVFFSGNRCERIYNNRGERVQPGANLYARKRELLFDRLTDPETAPSHVVTTSVVSPATERLKSSLQSGAPNPHVVTTSVVPPAPERLKSSLRGGDSEADVVTTSVVSSVRERLKSSRQEHPVRLTIGIPRALNFYENYPFWHTLFVECGLDVRLSDASSNELFQNGVRSVMSENICFPAKLLHGHIENLIEAGVDRIFYPMVFYEQREFADAVNSFNCPVVSGYPDVVRSAVDPQGRSGIPFDQPAITFQNRDLLKKTCGEYLAGLGVQKRAFERAFLLALAAQERYKVEVRALGAEILEKAAAEGRQVVVLAGHPYHLDPLVNHKIPEALADMGVDVITEDAVPLGRCQMLPDPQVLTQWEYLNRCFHAAHWVGGQEHAELAQLNSFGCGPDAFALDEVKGILAEYGKNHTVLRIDEIDSLGSARLRLRSMLEALKEKKSANLRECSRIFDEISENSRGLADSTDGNPRKTTRLYRKSDRRKVILVPEFSRFCTAPIVRPAMDMGYKIEVLPTPDQESVQVGLKYANNEICYPGILVIGDVIKALQSGRVDPDEVIAGSWETGGQCRASNISCLLKKALVSAGFENIPVVTLSTRLKSFNPQPEFQFNLVEYLYKAMLGMVFTDGISAMYHATAVRELQRGDARTLAEKWMAPFEDGTMPLTRHSVLSSLRQAVAEFNSLATHRERLPRVGIVGEIYVKYNPFVNNHIVQWLMDQELEVMLPPLLTFFIGSFVGQKAGVQERIRKPDMLWFLASAAHKLVQAFLNEAEAVLHSYRYYFPHRTIVETAQTAKSILHLTHQYGEGWLLSGEVGEFVKSGVQNVLCLQPFGCIANHVIAKGVARRLKLTYPEMNLLFLDLDAGMSEVNLLNRAHFFVEQAKASSTL